MKNKVIKIIIFSVFLLIFLMIFIISGSREVGESQQDWTEQMKRTPVSVETIDFNRISPCQIQISWTDDLDELVSTYYLKRRSTSQEETEWEMIAEVSSDGTIDGMLWTFTDELESADIQRYEYRVDVEVRDGSYYEAMEGKSILASNVKVCIDPGHYDIAREVAEADGYGYVEGKFVLEIALELRQILKERYGIDSSMTRETDTITLGGYTDEELDSAHISLRGEFAEEEDCDLFVSLHTNSNEEDANGYDTYFQPIAINKPIIIVNTVALTSDSAMKAANAAGAKLASVSYELGLSDTDSFKEVTADTIGEWTKEYNDGLYKTGTVVVRTGRRNPDYYGVLRGATDVGIPGMIIEHGYHSIQQVRKAAIESDLKEVWANADAVGIAYGFGFTE